MTTQTVLAGILVQYNFAGEAMDEPATVFKITGEKYHSAGSLEYYEDGYFLVPYQFSIVSWSSTSYAKAFCDNYVTDKKGNKIIYSENGRIYFNDKYMENTVSIEGDVIAGYGEGLFTLIKYTDDGALYGFADRDGNLVIPYQYQYASAFSNGLCLVGKSALDSENRESYVYDANLHENIQLILSVNQCDEVGYINRNNHMVIPYSNKYGTERGANASLISYADFHEGLAVVYDNESGFYGYIDNEGNLAIEFKYIRAYDFDGGYADVIYSNEEGSVTRGAIDKNGKIIVTGMANYYDNIGVKPISGTDYGYDDNDIRNWSVMTWLLEYVNADGEKIVPDEYMAAGKFKNGLASVKIPGELYAGNTTSSIIDKKGNAILKGSTLNAAVYDSFIVGIDSNTYYVIKNPYIPLLKLEDEYLWFLDDPYISNGRMIVSTREISDYLHIEYEVNNNIVIMTKDGVKMTYQLGESKYYVNEQEKAIATTEQVSVEDVAFIPLSIITDAFNYELYWNSDDNTAYIGFRE